MAEWRSGEALLDAAQKLVANGPIGIEPLLAVALLDGGIRSRPVFDLGRHPAGQLEGLMMGFRGQRDNEIEIQSLPALELFDLHGTVLPKVEAHLLQHPNRDRI